MKAADTRQERPDAGCAGLYLIVQPTGAKSWALRYRTPAGPKKLTLGPLAEVDNDAEPVIGHPLSLSQARALAAVARDQVKRGITPTKPAAVTKASEGTVDAAMVEFMVRYKGRKRQGLRESTKRNTAHHLGLRPDGDTWKPTGRGVLKVWSGRPLASVTKRDAIAVLDAMADTAPVAANRTLTVLKTFFHWAVKRDLLEASPVAMLDPPSEEKSRERTLSDAEIKAVWHAGGPLLQLLLLTGARRDELREAPWSEFDLDARTWLLPASRAKNGREHLVPLSSLTMEILKSLPRIGTGKLLFTVNGRTPFNNVQLPALEEHWTLHDLRRTFASGLQRLGIPIEVIEECLNHKSGTRSGVAGIYARHRYVAERTQALEAWAEHVRRIVA